MSGPHIPNGDEPAHAVDDGAARREALEPGRSFIVQAPAGSGKTELLIQRYLVLLAQSNEPEEIAAITFTRKASAEMKLRVMAALDAARAAGDDELAPHERHTRTLARRVLSREATRGWNLAANAQRLRIQTFDSLCASLTRQMPVLSAFGAQPRSVENAGRLYREAARAALAQLDDEAPHANDIASLLLHLDNNLAAVEEMLAAMLARRDHWLPHLFGASQREVLEHGLAEACRGAHRTVAALFPAASIDDLCVVACYAADNLAANGSASPIVACGGMRKLPGEDEEGHAVWLGLATLLLTNEGTWRSRLDVNIGFPPGAGNPRGWKERTAVLIQSLDSIPGLADALHALRALPAAAYTEAQWQVLGAITRLLPLAVAQLKLVFAARGEADFVEVAQRANLALGDAEAPTDLMLALDYRIHHLLVDEFQDSSYTQVALLEKLVAGWNEGDPSDDVYTAKTLFLVGDPMQSIYRFRQAEVGLFLAARRTGLGGVDLVPLTLSANFRSRAGIVNWVNGAFGAVMPASDDMATGAVSYAPSQAVRADGEAHQAGRVVVHAGFHGVEGEAACVAAIVQSARTARPQGTVAVLVRTRSVLRAIAPALRQAGLAFQSIEIEPLGHRQAVQDVYSLTRALAHGADRIAWLSVLRAPWCGLSLADLNALAGRDASGAPASSESQQDFFGVFESTQASPVDGEGGDGTPTLWEAVCSPSQGLTSDGAARLARLRESLASIVENSLRGSLRARVESAWLALGGPGCVMDASDIEDVDIYFDCLAKHEEAGEITDPAEFAEAVERLFALPDSAADERLQIMTIHKAKGLEFDTVIVPGLHAGSRSDEKRLLAWMETPLGEDAGGRGTLLIAPVNPAGSDNEPTYQYLRQLEKVKARHEETRLLYVAATRAREELHWLGNGKLDKNGAVGSPPGNSLLARLWPVLEADFKLQHQNPAAPHIAQGTTTAPTGISQLLRRFKSDWQIPTLPAPVTWAAPSRVEAGREAVEFSWAGETARHVGSVVHRWMQRIAEDGLSGWNDARVETLRDAFHAQLAARGVAEAECVAAAGRVAESMKRTLDDPRGRWLLEDRTTAQSEYRLSSMDGGVRRDWIIDRTFVDDEGNRWIVDFKTSRHEGADVDGFMDRERERYRGQLEGYAKLLSVKADGALPGSGAASANGNVRLGLYFPLLGGWREWEYGVKG